MVYVACYDGLQMVSSVSSDGLRCLTRWFANGFPVEFQSLSLLISIDYVGFMVLIPMDPYACPNGLPYTLPLSFKALRCLFQ